MQPGGERVRVCVYVVSYPLEMLYLKWPFELGANDVCSYDVGQGVIRVCVCVAYATPDPLHLTGLTGLTF